MFIGQFTDVAVRITIDSDVIFDVDLPVELEDPVRLYLKYVDVDSGKVDEVQTSAMYTNLRNIRHIEFDSNVIFERFQVTIAVESVDGTRGPLRPAGQYGEFNSSTQCHTCGLPHLHRPHYSLIYYFDTKKIKN